MIQLYLSYDAVSKYNTRTQELVLMVPNIIISNFFFSFLCYQGQTFTICSGINTVYTDIRNTGLCFIKDVLCSNILENHTNT